MPNSNKRLSRAVPVLAAAVLFGAASVRAKPIEETVAFVNGKPLLLSEYKKNLESVLEQYRKNMPDALKDDAAVKQIREKVLDQMVDDELLAQRAEKDKVKVSERELDNGVQEIKQRFSVDEEGRPLAEGDADGAFQNELKKEGLSLLQFRERIKRQLMVRKLIESDVRPRADPPKEADIRAYFDRMQYFIKGDTSAVKGMGPDEAQQFQLLATRLRDASAERVRARHILIRVPKDASMVDKSKALNRIKDVQQQLKDGADFAELARKYSEDPESKKRGGDLGFFLKGWMVPEFEKAAFALDVGQTSDIVETQFGYHLIHVEEKRAAQKVQFDDVKDQLGQALMAMRVQGELEKLVKDLRAQATIEKNLPQDAARNN